MDLDRTFVTADDDALIQMISSANERLVIVAPGLTTPVAMVLVDRIQSHSLKSVTVILDSDPEVYRVGYGDVNALEMIHKACSEQLLALRQQPGIRIGIVVSDHWTMVFSPVPLNVEAGSTREDKPNALLIEGHTADTLADAADFSGDRREIGNEALTPEHVRETVENLKSDPPQPFDLSRKLRVFQSVMQFIELTMKTTQLNTRRIRLPKHFQKFNNDELRSRIASTLAFPLDLKTRRCITIENDSDGYECLKINESDINIMRKDVNRLIYNWPGRGKVVLRRDKDSAKRQLDRLIKICKAYHKSLQEDTVNKRDEFRKQIVDEFLDLWIKDPPRHLVGRGKVTEEVCKFDLENEAGMMFDKAVELGKPHYELFYKDVAIEDLKNDDLMRNLASIMQGAGVEEDVYEKLFSEVDAAQSTMSFNE